MLKYKLLLLFATVYLSMLPASQADQSSGRVKVFLLAGQSNLTGQGLSSNLLSPYNAVQTDVPCWVTLINNGRSRERTGTEWEDLQPGFGRSTTQFGPEVSFGHSINQALPEDDIYIIKYGADGTALYNDWQPDKAAYGGFTETVANALANLDAMFFWLVVKVAGR